MGLTMLERKAVIATVAPRYQKATKQERGTILDEFVRTTGYHRVYAPPGCCARMVERFGSAPNGRSYPTPCGPSGDDGPDARGEGVVAALRRIWVVMDCICSKRLQPALPEIIDVLERHGERRLDWNTKKDLLQIRTATIDRLLARERKKFALRSAQSHQAGHARSSTRSRFEPSRNGTRKGRALSRWIWLHTMGAMEAETSFKPLM